MLHKIKKYAILMYSFIAEEIGNVWCLFVHGFIMRKHKMLKAYDPYVCQKCGRLWELL